MAVFWFVGCSADRPDLRGLDMAMFPRLGYVPGAALIGWVTLQFFRFGFPAIRWLWDRPTEKTRTARRRSLRS